MTAQFDGVQKRTLPKPSAKRPNKGISSWLIIATIVIVGALTYGYYWSVTNNQLSPTSSTPTTTPTPTQATTPTNALTVSLYDSGGGTDATNSVSQTLQKNNYQVTNLGASQLTYDKTYIWYQKDYTAQANAIATLLNNREVSLHESAITGSFKILIYVGEK